MQLHYQTAGEGHPILLLHGLFGSANNWGTIAKHFAQTHQVISVDLRNHGQSPHHASQTYDDMANDLMTLCNALDLDAFHLIGHSLGGKVAMQFATQYPERMDKLIIVDMAMRTYEDVQTYLIDSMLALDLTQIKTRGEADQILSARIDNVKVRQFLLMNLVKMDGHWQWRINLPALKANYPTLRQAVCESALYEKPCLFIRGDRSDYIGDSDIDHIKAHFTKAQFVTLAAGHWVHAEQPQAFIDAVDTFLGVNA